MTQFKQNNTAERVVYQPKTANGFTIDFTGATADFYMVKGSETFINAPALVDEDNDQLVYEFTPQDTLYPGNYIGEFRVVFPDGTIKHYPEKGYLGVRIEQVLNPSETTLSEQNIALQVAEVESYKTELRTEVRTELVEAAEPYPTLKERLDNADVQLAEKATQEALDKQTKSIVGARNLIYKTKWEQGTSNGITKSSSTVRLRATERVPFDKTKPLRVELNGSYQVYIYGYPDNLESTTPIKAVGYISADTTYDWSAENINYIYFVAKRTDGAAISVNDVDKFNILLINEIQNPVPIKLKVASFNIGMFGEGSGRGVDNATQDVQTLLMNTRRFIAKMKCDYIGIQEYTQYFDRNDTIDADTDLMAYLYPNMLYSYLPTGSKIFSKYPLLNTVTRTSFTNQDQNDTAGTRYYQKAYIQLGNKKICLLNTHLTTGDYQVRLAQIQELINIAGSEKYSIITGDFNTFGDGGTNPEGSEFDLFLSNGYRMANFDYFGEFITASNGKRIDNVVVSSNIKIDNVEVLSEDTISDHYPVIAELSIF